MNREYVNSQIIEEFGFAEENGFSEPVVSLYLFDERKIEIWYDEQNECYMFSGCDCGYEDLLALQKDLWKNIGDSSVEAIELE